MSDKKLIPQLDLLQDYELRLVGHSLGGSTAALLALMLREGNGSRELEISPELIKAVIIASPPCVSRKLSRKCSHYITTLVLQVLFLNVDHLLVKCKNCLKVSRGYTGHFDMNRCDT